MYSKSRKKTSEEIDLKFKYFWGASSCFTFFSFVFERAFQWCVCVNVVVRMCAKIDMISCIINIILHSYFSLEGNRGREHLFDERRRRHQVLQFKVEDPLQALHAERSEGRQPVQDAREILGLFLRLRVVRHVILQRVDHLVLQMFDLFRVAQSVTFWRRLKYFLYIHVYPSCPVINMSVRRQRLTCLVYARYNHRLSLLYVHGVYVG